MFLLAFSTIVRHSLLHQGKGPHKKGSKTNKLLVRALKVVPHGVLCYFERPGDRVRFIHLYFKE